MVAVCQRRCGSNRNIIPELAVEKPPLMEHGEKRLAYFKLKWKGQYGQDRGFSGFTVQWWCLKAWSFSNVGGTVVPSISAIVLSLALCTCQHHCSLSQINVDFALQKESRGSSALIREIAMASVWEPVSLQMPKFLWHVYCCLLFCGGHSLRSSSPSHCSCHYSSMRNLECRVNREPENNKHKKRENFHPSVVRLFSPEALSSVPTTCCPLFVA